MTIEERLQDLILSRYPTMKAFADVCGLKYSTLRTVFYRGIDKTGATNLKAICQALGITLDGLGRNEIEFLPDKVTDQTTIRAEQNRLLLLMLDGKVLLDGEIVSEYEARVIDDQITAAADIIRRMRDRNRGAK